MTLEDLRIRIDKIDHQINDLLNERAKIALEVGKLKKQEKGDNAVFYQPKREQQVLDVMSEYNRGPLSNKAIIKIFQVIMTQCRQLQLEIYE